MLSLDDQVHEPDPTQTDPTNHSPFAPPEPTTGLDSCAAVAVVGLLKRTAQESNLTIIASIHQVGLITHGRLVGGGSEVAVLCSGGSGRASCGAAAVARSTSGCRSGSNSQQNPVQLTIHPTNRPPNRQPCSAVWEAFDTCTLLAHGLPLYYGPRTGMGAWFEGLGLGPWNPAVHGIESDWAMDLVSIEFAKPEVGAVSCFLACLDAGVFGGWGW